MPGGNAWSRDGSEPSPELIGYARVARARRDDAIGIYFLTDYYKGNYYKGIFSD